MPTLINDLAYILITAGIVTLLFKRLKQPLVLGYIVAGFLASPHMAYTPNISDTGSLDTWAQIGIIFLMFTLGLELSFKKIVKMGLGPVIAAGCIMFCMMSIGSGVGHLFGWDGMNSLFLGGMLAMSSTTIIYKAFDDLGLRQQKFAGEVLSVLILEDVLGILLMVVLSALAASRQFEGMQLVGSLLKLSFFLILWFIVGVYLVPTFLRRTGRWMNKETLLIVSIGLCFLLVVLASKAGYSAAFGAFMMGSILAETVEAESINRVVTPVKDLFGAIFFVSVGMMVDPTVLVDYALPIVVLCAAIICGQAVFGTTGFLLPGQPLRTAIRGGFSLAQIGEFAFIIASLGISLGVTATFLYPVVVAVSVITTFLTPYMIRAAQPACDFIERHLPDAMLHRLSDRKRATADLTPEGQRWKRLLSALATQAGAYLTLSIGVVIISFAILLPLCRTTLGHWPRNAVCALLTLTTTAPFLRALVIRKNHSEEWKGLARRGRLNRLGLTLTFVVRYVMAAAVVYYIADFLSPARWYWHVAASLAVVAVIIALRPVKWISIRLERRFVLNLRQRETVARQNGDAMPHYARRLAAHNLHIAHLDLPDNTLWAGRCLADLNFSHNDGVLVAAIVRGSHRLQMPDGHTMLFPNDGLDVIGDDDSLHAFAQRVQAEVATAADTDSESLRLSRLVIRDNSPFVCLRLSQTRLREDYHCLVVGFENEEGNIDPPSPDNLICRGDVLWLVGEEDDIKRALEASVNLPESSDTTPTPSPSKGRA